MTYQKLITKDIRLKVLNHVKKTLAVSNRRPATEIADALLSWERAIEQCNDLERILGSIKGKKLLEIGSGYGLFLTIALRKRAKANGIEPAKNRSYMLTLDISKQILKRANLPDNLVKNAFGEKLPFKDNSFDLVVSFYTLEHVQNVEKVFKEASRVLKQGGHIFFVVPNYGSFWEGHYGIFWIPYLPKTFAKFYVRLWGKDATLLNELQLVNVYFLKKICKKLSIEIIDSGKTLFKEKVIDLKFASIGTLGSASKFLSFMQKLKILSILANLANFFEAQTPIILVGRKK